MNKLSETDAVVVYRHPAGEKKIQQTKFIQQISINHSVLLLKGLHTVAPGNMLPHSVAHR